MLLSHAVLFAEARCYIAALADRATSFEASLEYERVLLQLDWIHDNEVPSLTIVPTSDATVLYSAACRAVAGLARHGVDALAVELCLAMLEAARSLDTRA
jgi:hypothetical protein